MGKEFSDTINPTDTISVGICGTIIEIKSIRHFADHPIYLTPSDARDFANQILALVQDIETS